MSQSFVPTRQLRIVPVLLTVALVMAWLFYWCGIHPWNHYQQQVKKYPSATATAQKVGPLKSTKDNQAYRLTTLRFQDRGQRLRTVPALMPADVRVGDQEEVILGSGNSFYVERSLYAPPNPRYSTDWFGFVVGMGPVVILVMTALIGAVIISNPKRRRRRIGLPVT